MTMAEYHLYKIATHEDDTVFAAMVLDRIVDGHGAAVMLGSISGTIEDEEMKQLGYGDEYEDLMYASLTVEEASDLFAFMSGCGYKYVALVNPPIEEE